MRRALGNQGSPAHDQATFRPADHSVAGKEHKVSAGECTLERGCSVEGAALHGQLEDGRILVPPDDALRHVRAAGGEGGRGADEPGSYDG